MRELFKATVSDLARWSGEPLPDSNLIIKRAASVFNPHSNSLIFVKRLEPKPVELLSSTGDSLILVPEDAPEELTRILRQCNLVVPVRNPRLTFARVMNAVAARIHRQVAYVERKGAFIADSAVLHEGSVIEPGAFVDHDVIIGNGVYIMSGARIRAYSRIGDGSIIRENSVIGSAGYGFERDENGQPIRLPHFGGVEIGSRVEIGAFTVVCSGTIDPTVLEDDVKVDNLVHIAHNVRVGRGSMIVACAELSGSVQVGRYCWVGPNAAVIEGVKIGDGATVGLGAVVLKDVPDEEVVAGNPARRTAELSRLNKILAGFLESSNPKGFN